MYDIKLKESYFPKQSGGNEQRLSTKDMLAESVKKWPYNKALRELHYNGNIGREWTYTELSKEAYKLSNALASRHKQGAKIAIFANNIPEWVILELAAGIAGLVLVTVNPSFQASELKYVLEQSGAEAIYYAEEFRGNPLGDIVRSVCNEIPEIEYQITLTDQSSLYEGSSIAHHRTVKPDDPVQIQYTSGTTGFPKGAVLHHHGLIKNGRDSQARSGAKPGQQTIHFLPLFHTTGCAIMVLGGLATGVTITLSPIFDPSMLVDVIAREKPRNISGVPTMIVALMEVAKAKKVDLSFVERIGSGGSMVPPELCRAAKDMFDAPIQIIYGQTETSPVIAQTWHSDSLEDLTETIGQPLPDVDVAIMDMQTRKILPLGIQGEICVRGYNVMHGYHDNPDATAATIDENGWLHTGDLGTMDARGYIKITGRVKEMIIRGGENLFPVEIENAILQHPAIGEAAVVGVPDPKWGEIVVCFMRASGNEQPDDAELKDYIRKHISAQKTPNHWRWVNEWPLTGSGKIQKFKLREMFEKGD